MTAIGTPRPRQPAKRASGSYLVTRGDGRRRQQSAFSCNGCSDVTDLRPACGCRIDAMQFARLLGPGATVIRGEAAVFLVPA